MKQFRLYIFAALFIPMAFATKTVQPKVLTPIKESALSKNDAGWEIDQNHSKIEFNIKYLGIIPVHGTFDKYESKLDWHPTEPSKSSVFVKIAADSINTGIEKRDTHLKNEDFFNVEKYPNIIFKSTEFKREKGNLYVTGDLTMHGVTKKVTLKMDNLSDPVKNPMGKTVYGGTAQLILNRSDYNIKSYGAVVSDRVEILVPVIVMQKDAPISKS